MEWRQYEPNAESIDRISEWVQETCSNCGLDSRETQRIRLTVEDALIRIFEHDIHRIDVGIGSRFGRKLFCLRYEGAPCDPGAHGGDDWSGRILENLGISPSWSYRFGTNRLSIVIADRALRGSTFNILAAVAAAVILGLLGRLLPESARSRLDSVLLTPTANAFLGLLNTFAGIMVAFAICSGILGMGDAATLKKTGRRIIRRVVLLTFISSIFALALAAPLLGLRISGGSQSQISQAEKISEMLFAILPSDPVSPFLNRNTMQIIVIVIFVGVGLLAIGERAEHLRDIIDDGNALFSHLMEIICRLIPVYVFTALLRQLWSGGIDTWITLWKPVALTIGLILLFLLILLRLTAWQLHCPMRQLGKKVLPPTLIAFTTSSSVAAFQSAMETGKEELGIDPSFMQFAYPIGAVMYMPSGAITLAVLAVYFAKVYGIAVNLSWLIMAVVTASLLAIAVPPLPGSGFMIFGTLYAQLGIPAEALLHTTLIYMVADYFISGGNILSLLIELAREANQLNIMDRAKLTKNR